LLDKTDTTASVTFNYSCSYNVTAHVFVDYNGDGEENGDDYDYAGATVSSSAGSPTPQTTNALGNVLFAAVPAGNDTVTLTVPDDYAYSPASGANPRTVSGPPDPATINFGIIPLYSISGFVYTDVDKSKDYSQPPDSHYGNQPLQIKVCQGASCNTYNTDANGAFDTDLAYPAGAYRVYLNGLPDSSYSYIYPTGGSYPGVNVGTPCGSEPAGVSCNAGNASKVDFGISNSNVWIQSVGGDIYMRSGITYSKIPQNACNGSYMSIAQGQIASPGIIYTGNGTTIDFGAGLASAMKWAVGQASPETIDVPVRMSYTNRKNLLDGAHYQYKTLSCTTCNSNLGNNLEEGVYLVDGDLTINNLSTFTGNKNYEFLVHGNLHINANIVVDKGSTVFFEASGNITVDKDVGEADSTSSTPDLQGFYSAGGSFIVEGIGVNKCPAPDKRLNMQGSIVGNLQINRDMCAGDDCPTVSIQTRPDFVINAPPNSLSTKEIMKQVAP
jgi:hypothetical protein